MNQTILDAPSGDIALRTELNKLRINLPDALVSTYTYSPFGVTSETDARGKTTYYEYDGFGRLSLIRDHDNNIIKKICYNYAGQVEDCGYMPANWQATGNYRCVKDISSNNTGAQEKEERDMQTQSATYNQVRWVSNGVNLTACPLPVVCNTGNCSGVAKKCVNNICETGIRINTSSVQTGIKEYECTYHYEWSDGSWSGNYVETNTRPCATDIF